MSNVFDALQSQLMLTIIYLKQDKHTQPPALPPWREHRSPHRALPVVSHSPYGSLQPYHMAAQELSGPTKTHFISLHLSYLPSTDIFLTSTRSLNVHLCRPLCNRMCYLHFSTITRGTLKAITVAITS